MFIRDTSSEKGKDFGKIVKIDEDEVKKHLGEIVRSTVEETLNGLLDAEAEALCGAALYERNGARKDYRAGHYQRGFHTKAGKVKLKIPKLRLFRFETAIIERYRRRESSVEEAMIEMYLAGVSVRRVEDITKVLWDSKVSPGTISNLNKKIYARIEEWRNMEITDEHKYIYLDGIWLKRSWGGEVKNVSILVAVGVNSSGYREVLGVMEGSKEDKESWGKFLSNLKERGLKGVQLVTSDKCLGLIEILPDFYPEASWQRCIVHWYKNVLSLVPRSRSKAVAAMLKAIHAQEDRESAIGKAKTVAEKLNNMKLKRAAKLLRESIDETLSYMNFPREHWSRIRTNNMLERIMKEIRRRTRVVGSFPDGNSALMLVAARLKYIAGNKWGLIKYMNMDLKREEVDESKSTFIG